MKELEIINKEVWKWEYFSEKDLSKSLEKEDGIIISLFLFFIKLFFPEFNLNAKGYYKVRYFEIVNIRNGKVRLLKAKKGLEAKEE